MALAASKGPKLVWLTCKASSSRGALDRCATLPGAGVWQPTPILLQAPSQLILAHICSCCLPLLSRCLVCVAWSPSDIGRDCSFLASFSRCAVWFPQNCHICAESAQCIQVLEQSLATTWRDRARNRALFLRGDQVASTQHRIVLQLQTEISIMPHTTHTRLPSQANGHCFTCCLEDCSVAAGLAVAAWSFPGNRLIGWPHSPVRPVQAPPTHYLCLLHTSGGTRSGSESHKPFHHLSDIPTPSARPATSAKP